MEIKKDIKKRKRGRPTEESGINKEAILKIALEAFAEFGFDGVSVISIAKRAKVDDSLLHYHFGTKEELWKKSIELASAKYVEESEKTIRILKDLDVKALGKALIRHFVYYVAENIELYQVVLHEVTQKSERTAWIIDHFLKPWGERIVLYLKAYAKENNITEIPVANFSSMCYGLFSSFFVLQYYNKNVHGIQVFDDAQIVQHADLTTEMFFAFLESRKK